MIGKFPQTPTGAINIEIAGTALPEFDQLEITDQASLNGSLNITLVGGFQPDLGDSFTVLIFGTRSGVFTNENGLDIGNDKRFEVRYSEDSVALIVVPAN